MSIGAIIGICVAATCLVFLVVGAVIFSIHHRRKATQHRDRAIIDAITQVVGPGGRLPYILPREALLREPPPRYTSQAEINDLSIVNPGFRDDEGVMAAARNISMELDRNIPVPLETSANSSSQGLAPPVYRSNPNMCNVSMNSIDCEPPPRYTSRQDIEDGGNRVPNFTSQAGSSRGYGLRGAPEHSELPILQAVHNQATSSSSSASHRHSRHFDVLEYQNARQKMLERLEAQRHETEPSKSVALPTTSSDTSKDSAGFDYTIVQVHKESSPGAYEMKTVHKHSSSVALDRNEVVNLSYKEASSTDSIDSIDFSLYGPQLSTKEDHGINTPVNSKTCIRDRTTSQPTLYDFTTDLSCHPESVQALTQLNSTPCKSATKSHKSLRDLKQSESVESVDLNVACSKREKCLDTSYAVLSNQKTVSDKDVPQMKKARSLSYGLNDNHSIHRGGLNERSSSIANISDKPLSHKPMSRSTPQLHKLTYTLQGSSESLHSCHC